MKVKIGKYLTYWGPYQIAEALCFWAKRDVINGKPDYVHNFGTWLAEDKEGNDSWLTKACNWVYNKSKRKVSVKIDPWDSYNADHTLALIVVPLLKQIQKTKHGAPYTDDSDVPEHLRSYNAKPKENDWDTDEFHFQRFDWILDEILWGMQQIAEYKPLEGTFFKFSDDYEIGGKGSCEIDSEGLKAYEDRIQNSCRLLGRYLQNMWD